MHHGFPIDDKMITNLVKYQFSEFRRVREGPELTDILMNMCIIEFVSRFTSQLAFKQFSESRRICVCSGRDDFYHWITSMLFAWGNEIC